MKSSILAFVLLAVATCYAQTIVQTGHRFPLGVQLGNYSVDCESHSDIGLLRFHENQVEVCQQTSETTYGFTVVGSNETIYVNGELTDLRNRVEELEASNEVGLGPRLDRSNLLDAIQMCHLHGVYDEVARRCVCDCDATLGCWNSTSFCTTCANGWVGDYCLGDVEAPVITMLGESVMAHEAGDVFVDPGVVAHDNKDLDVTSEVAAESTVVSNAVGTYTVTYTVTDNGGNTAVVVRTVEVVDTTIPEITLFSPLSLTLEAGEPYAEPGYNATDNAVGTLDVVSSVSSLNLRLTGLHIIEYSLTDDAGNAAVIKTRNVTVIDTTAPVISFLGFSDTYHEVGTTYVDAGVDISDNSDEPLNLETFNGVDDSAIGNYTVIYALSDASGNVAQNSSRIVRVRAPEDSCDATVRSAPESSFSNGIYHVNDGSGGLKDTYCRFENGVGYDLLYTLDTADSNSRYYGSSFWTSSTSYGSLSNPMGAEFKGTAYTQLDYLDEILIVLHDGRTAGAEVGSARYTVREPYHGSGLTYQWLMNTASDTVISYPKMNANVPLNLVQDSRYSADPFLERNEPLVANRQSGFGAAQNWNRLMTATGECPGCTSTHIFGGIGGDHVQNTWGVRYELSPVEQYCRMNNPYSDASNTISGNYVGNGQTNFVMQSDCIGNSAQTVYYPIDVSVFAAGGVQRTTVVRDSSDAYLQRNPGASDGATTLSDGRVVACVFDHINGKGYNVLLNLETSDSVSQYYGRTFWTGVELSGSASNALTAEFKGDDYVASSGMSELMILYHNNGAHVANATYELLQNVVSGKTFRDLIQASSDTIISNSKMNSDFDVGLVSNPPEREHVEQFMERNEPLVMNRQSAHGASRNWMRLATTYQCEACTSAHVIGGIGGDHVQNTWGIRYEVSATEQYCSYDNRYTDSSSTLSGNFVSNGQTNYVLQSDCAGPVHQYLPIDAAILARFSV